MYHGRLGVHQVYPLWPEDGEYVSSCVKALSYEWCATHMDSVLHSIRTPTYHLVPILHNWDEWKTEGQLNKPGYRTQRTKQIKCSS